MSLFVSGFKAVYSKKRPSRDELVADLLPGVDFSKSRASRDEIIEALEEIIKDLRKSK
jgi:hypothetical protein